MSHSSKSIPERWLHWTFAEKGWLPKTLEGTAAEKIRILAPGEPNVGDGPDFRNALLEIDGVCLRGDVEIHLYPYHWFQHGHHEDERYRRVILHLLWDAPTGIPALLTKRFTHVLIRQQLAVSRVIWQETMQERDDHPCYSKTADTVPLATLGVFAEQRFQYKIARMHEWMGHFSPDDALFLALGEALGYSVNKNAFRQLLWQYPASQVLSIAATPATSPWRMWLTLIHFAGLGDILQRSQAVQQHPQRLAVVDQLFYFQRLQGRFPVLQASDWHFSRVRPHNNPFLRLAALAVLLLHFRKVPLFKMLLDVACQRPAVSSLITQWQTHLTLPLPDNFAEHIRQTLNFAIAPRHALGKQRMRQFLINGALPALYCWAELSKNYGFREYLGAIYEHFPGVEELSTLKRLIGNHPNQKTLRHSGFYQQGVLEWAAMQKKSVKDKSLLRLG